MTRFNSSGAFQKTSKYSNPCRPEAADVKLAKGMNTAAEKAIHQDSYSRMNRKGVQ